MSDPLSISASAFAVVGLADVVLRTGKECYQFLCAIKDAPSEVQRLQECIQETALLVQNSRKYCKELKASSPSAQSSSTPAASDQVMLLFKSALRGFEREFSDLRIVARRYNVTTNTWGKIKWVLDERKLGKSMSRLEASKSTLVTALMLVGRRQDVAHQKDTKTYVQHSLQSLASNIESQLKAFATTCESRNNLSSSRDPWLRDGLQDLQDKSTLMQSSLANIHQASRVEHKETRTRIDHNTSKIINTISSKLDRLPYRIAQHNLSAKPSKRQIRYFGENQEAMLGSLLQLVPLINQATLRIRSQHSELVSMQHLSCLQSEFLNLVASATQEVAATSRGSTATPFDDWVHLKNLTGSVSNEEEYSSASATRKRSRSRSGSRADASQAKTANRRKRLKSNFQSFPFVSSSGTLRIMLPCQTTSSFTSSPHSDSDRIGFLFLPSYTAASTVIDTRFREVNHFESEPQLHAQINTFSFVPMSEWGPYYDLFIKGSIEDIDIALRSNRISPYAVDDEGQSLCIHFAARDGRVDVLQYLDSQGIGPSNLSGNHGALTGLASCIKESRIEQRSVDQMFDVLTYLDKRGVISASSCSSFLLHPTLIDSPATQFECPTDVHLAFRMWVKFLKEEEYDFEELDEVGGTPLLAYLSGSGAESLIWTSMLLEFGANAHALGPNGENALQYAMCSSHEEQHRDILEQKLYLLIKAGVNVNHRCMRGLTPSFTAGRYKHCWVEWCRALERNALSIQHVLEAETWSYPWEEDSEDSEAGEDSENYDMEDSTDQIKLTFGKDYTAMDQGEKNHGSVSEA